MAVINLWELSFTMAFMNLLRLGAAIPPQYPITTRSVFGGQPSERGYGIPEVPAGKLSPSLSQATRVNLNSTSLKL